MGSSISRCPSIRLPRFFAVVFAGFLVIMLRFHGSPQMLPVQSHSQCYWHNTDWTRSWLVAWFAGCHPRRHRRTPIPSGNRIVRDKCNIRSGCLRKIGSRRGDSSRKCRHIHISTWASVIFVPLCETVITLRRRSLSRVNQEIQWLGAKRKFVLWVTNCAARGAYV